MGLRAKLARLEKAMQGNLSSIELTDGSRYWFDPQQTGIVLFLYFMDSARTVYPGNPRPEPPELLRAVAGAKDWRETFSRICSGGVVPSLPVDVEALVERGEFVPRPLVRSEASDDGVGTPEQQEPSQRRSWLDRLYEALGGQETNEEEGE